MVKRIPAPPEYWQNYLLCLLFHMGLPLLPLAFEVTFTATIRASSAYITASLYALVLGVSSNNRLLFGLGIVIGLVFAATFGRSAALETTSPQASLSPTLPLLAILLLFLVHGLERYNRHVVDRAPYWEFLPREKS